MKWRYIFWCLAFLTFLPSLSAQNDWGGRAGVSLQFGTHIQRFGLMYQLYYFNDFIHVTQGISFNFNIKDLGPKGSFESLKAQVGLQGHWLDGKKKGYLINEFSNMSDYRNAIGYSFYFYLDNRRTSQSTGAFNVLLDEFILVLDNDAFGLNQLDDKFRTGGLYVGYQDDSLLFGLQNTLWTGKSSDGPRVDDTQYPSRFGYRDVRQAQYGTSSNGILAARVDYLGIYEQNFRAEMGIDAEQVRHFFQNKLIHDGISGRLVKSESPHYPMLQQDGTLYLYKERQKIRSIKPYIQLGLNQMLLY